MYGKTALFKKKNIKIKKNCIVFFSGKFNLPLVSVKWHAFLFCFWIRFVHPLHIHPLHVQYLHLCLQPWITMLLLLLSLQLCLTLCNPIDGSPPGSSVPGILQARTLECVPFPSPMHEREKGMWICSVVSDSLRPHGLQPTRLLCPWNYYKCIEIIIHLENWEMHIHLMKITILTSLLY